MEGAGVFDAELGAGERAHDAVGDGLTVPTRLARRGGGWPCGVSSVGLPRVGYGVVEADLVDGLWRRIGFAALVDLVL